MGELFPFSRATH